jgi:hypothetical protein
MRCSLIVVAEDVDEICRRVGEAAQVPYGP